MLVLALLSTLAAIVFSVQVLLLLALIVGVVTLLVQGGVGANFKSVLALIIVILCVLWLVGVG